MYNVSGKKLERTGDIPVQYHQVTLPVQSRDWSTRRWTRPLVTLHGWNSPSTTTGHSSPWCPERPAWMEVQGTRTAPESGGRWREDLTRLRRRDKRSRWIDPSHWSLYTCIDQSRTCVGLQHIAPPSSLLENCRKWTRWKGEGIEIFCHAFLISKMLGTATSTAMLSPCSRDGHVIKCTSEKIFWPLNP